MTARRLTRRLVAVIIVVLQLFLVVRAYPADHAVFGFQMFPESSEWQATIERELIGGERVDVRVDWPGGYRWADLVSGFGLGQPFSRQHAAYGLDSILDFLSEALEWVAQNTPLDPETVRLVATVTVWPNGRAAQTIIFEQER